MKKMRRMISCMVMFAIMITAIGTTSFAKQPDDRRMDDLDVAISASLFLNSDNSEDDFWPTGGSEFEIIPLYNVGSEIVAYYLDIEDGGYAVINNNLDNPTVIEFGEGCNPLIREILNQEKNPNIIYNSPESIFSMNDRSIDIDSLRSIPDLNETYPDLQQFNVDLSRSVSEKRIAIEKEIERQGVRGDGDYGFVEWGNMPSGTYSSGTIPFAGTNWVVTGDFSDIANNHCGATAVTNLAMYFANRGNTNLEKDTVRNTFIAVHSIVGNGPVFTIADKASTYFSNCGYTLHYSSVEDFNGIKSATNNYRPCGILLADGLVQWHWVLAVGYREYNSGDKYIRIMDGWRRDANRFYKPHSGSLWMSCTQYWV